MDLEDLRLTNGAGRCAVDAVGAGLECWQLSDPADVALRQWGDDVVVYLGHRATTHLLSHAAGGVLRALSVAPRALSVDALFAGTFGDAAGAAITADERTALNAVLLQFEQLGMADRALRPTP